MPVTNSNLDLRSATVTWRSKRLVDLVSGDTMSILTVGELAIVESRREIEVTIDVNERDYTLVGGDDTFDYGGTLT